MKKMIYTIGLWVWGDRLVEEIQSKNTDRNEENISENIVPNLDDMFGSEIPTDEHPASKRYGPRKDILPTYQDSEKGPDEPKDGHRRRKSFCLEGWEPDEEGVIEVVPYSRPRDEEIPENIQEEKTEIVKIFPFLWGMWYHMISGFSQDGSNRQEYHAEGRNPVDEPARKREYEVRSEKTPNDRHHRANPEKVHGNMSIFIKNHNPPEDIADFSKLVGNTRELWRKSEKRHESYSENRNTSRREAPEVGGDHSYDENNKNCRVQNRGK